MGWWRLLWGGVCEDRGCSITVRLPACLPTPCPMPCPSQLMARLAGRMGALGLSPKSAAAPAAPAAAAAAPAASGRTTSAGGRPGRAAAAAAAKKTSKIVVIRWGAGGTLAVLDALHSWGTGCMRCACCPLLPTHAAPSPVLFCLPLQRGGGRERALQRQRV